MKTRRDFLAALGLGAGASMMGLPGLAHACGGRWRRACGVANVNESAGVDAHTKVLPLGHTTNCNCACPQYLYFKSNGINYYSCICCDTKTACNASSSYNYPVLPLNCPNSTCIGSCAGGGSPTSKSYRNSLAADPCYFQLDPDHLDPDGVNVHAQVFIDGITAKAAAVLHNEISGHPHVMAMTTLVTRLRPVKYDLEGTHYVALYDASWAAPPATTPKPCTLHVGFEISPDTSITNPPDDWGIPFKKALPHYHRVYVGEVEYHVVTAKA